MREFFFDYRYLKAFLLTARCLSFSKAAQELGIAQSAVSRQIKLLEDSVGEQLIVRSSKKVILTEKGLLLLKEMEDFESKVREVFFHEFNKTIRIRILHGILETWFNEVLVEYTKIYPHQLMVEVNTLDRLKENLHNGKYDFIFTVENIQSEIASSLKLFEEKMVLISKDQIQLKEAHQYPWIVYSDQDHLFSLYKKRSPKIIVVNSITTILKLVKKGVGIAIVPEHTVESTGIHTYEVKGMPRQYIYLSTLNFHQLPDHLKKMMEMIKIRQPA